MKETNKVALVTGASSGIGKATVKRLLEEGYTVYAAARSVDKMMDIEENGARIIRLDISSNDSIEKCANTVLGERGRIDVLFNNAGFGMYGSVEETSIEDARYQFEVNIFGLARLTQLLIPQMRKQQSGVILNTSSIGGRLYTPLGAWYHATKHALEGWSDCLRIELKQFGIKVVVIEPGPIRTSFIDVMFKPMVERSGKGPYSKMVNGLVRTCERIYRGGTEPEVIAGIVARAIRKKRPKTRYVKGKLAGPSLFARKWFGDRVYDRFIVRMFR